MGIGVNAGDEGGQDAVDIKVLHLEEGQVVHVKQQAGQQREHIGRQVVHHEQHHRVDNQAAVRMLQREETAVDQPAVADGELHEEEDADQRGHDIEGIPPGRIVAREVEVTRLLVGEDVEQGVEHIGDERQQQAAAQRVEPEFHSGMYVFDCAAKLSPTVPAAKRKAAETIKIQDEASMSPAKSLHFAASGTDYACSGPGYLHSSES